MADHTAEADFEPIDLDDAHPFMQNTQMAYHLTLTLYGWSNARMESIYSWNVIFPTRKVMLLKAQDLSTMVHFGDNLSDEVTKGMRKWDQRSLQLL
ncbi:hypothetical protein WJX77_007778 [Trebouxia sp. C0004]